MGFFRGGGGSGGPGSTGSYDETEEMAPGGGSSGCGGSGGGGGGAGVSSLSIADAADDVHDRRPPGCCDGSKRKRRCLAAAVAVTLAALASAVALGLAGRLPGRSYFSSAATPPSHPSYNLEYSSVVSEYDLTVALYRHAQTDAEFLAVMPNTYDGEDKAFAVGFRTVPSDSTGVPHILEHSVLSGSRKYPVKDPFLHLLKGSLQTFLNAMTYADRTVYPVASRNRQDFRNLADVYLDAVFHPRCIEEEWVLKQEGWRYEVDPDSGELERRGVVMSEMMGAYSDPDEVMAQTSQSLLFPDTTYKYDSGGEPGQIPSLTFERFRDFYGRHYHPTNSKIYVNGDADDVKMALDLADTYLSEYEYDPTVRSASAVPYQSIKFNSPVRERRPYASAEGDEGSGHRLTIQWLLHDDPLPPLTELALRVLDDLLLGDPSSPLRKALLDSGLGEDVIDDGLDDELLQNTFTVGLKGIKDADDVAKAEGVIMDALERVANEGFDPDDVEASMNSVEFELREFHTGSTARGVVVFLAVMSKWNYDMDPRSALAFEETLGALRAEIEENGSAIFQSLAQTYLVANTHRVVLEFYPSATYESERAAQEKKILASIKASLTPEQLRKIEADAKALADLQAKDDPPEAVASIPSLSLADLDKKGVEHPIAVRNNLYGAGVTVVTHAVPSSSGVLYVDFGLDVSDLPLEDAPLLPLLARMMTETGTSTLSERELDRQIGMHTGGIDVDALFTVINPAGVDDSVVTPGSNLRTVLFVKGKCTTGKSAQLFSLFHQILTDAKLDSPRKAVQILQEMTSELRTGVVSSGSSFASRRIEARYSVSGFLRERAHGISQAGTLEVLLETAQKDWPTLLGRLVRMRNSILGGSRGEMVLNLTGDRRALDAAKPDVRDFLENKVPSMPMPKAEGAADDRSGAPPRDFRAVDHPWVAAARAAMADTVPIRDEGVSVPTEVNYVGRGGILFDTGERVPGSAFVATRYLTTGYLWENVRVRNGAYGSTASFDRREGTLVLTSYRDPELGKTLDVFGGAADSLLEDASPGGALREQDGAALTKAIIGAIGRLDGSAPPPSMVGWVSLLRWMRGESAEARQRWREEVLNTKVGNFADFAQRLKNWKSPSSAVVASQGALDEYALSAGSTPLEIILTL